MGVAVRNAARQQCCRWFWLILATSLLAPDLTQAALSVEKRSLATNQFVLPLALSSTRGRRSRIARRDILPQLHRLRGGSSSLSGSGGGLKRQAPTVAKGGFCAKMFNVTSMGMGFFGMEDGLAKYAGFAMPTGIAYAPDGALYISDSCLNTIRRIGPDLRKIETIAGIGEVEGLKESLKEPVIAVDENSFLAPKLPEPSHLYNDGAARGARFNSPQGIAVNSKGDIFVADSANHAVRKISSGKHLGLMVTHFAGRLPDGSMAIRGQKHSLSAPNDIAVDKDDNVYVADTGACKIRKYSPEGKELACYGRMLDNITEEFFLAASRGLLPGQQGIVARTPEEAREHNRLPEAQQPESMRNYKRLFPDDPSSSSLSRAPTPSPLPYLHELYREYRPELETGFVDVEVKPASSRNDARRRYHRMYIPSDDFTGKKKGYVFTTGEHGIGYYLDENGQDGEPDDNDEPMSAAGGGGGGGANDDCSEYYSSSYYEDDQDEAKQGEAGEQRASDDAIITSSPPPSVKNGGGNLRGGAAAGSRNDRAQPPMEVDEVDNENGGVQASGEAKIDIEAALEALSDDVDSEEREREVNEEIKNALRYMKENDGELPAKYVLREGQEIPRDPRYERERKLRDPLGLLPDTHRLRTKEAREKDLREPLDLPCGGFRDGPVSIAKFMCPRGIALDSKGNIFIADGPIDATSPYDHKIRKIDVSQGVVTTYSGADKGDIDGSRTTALFFSPVGLAFDSRDNLFVVEQYGNRVRRINPTGEVTTIAGKPFSVNTQKWSVDGVPFEFFLPDAPDDDPQDPEDPGWPKGRLLDGMGHTARFKLPSMIAVGADDAAYVTDTFNFQVRELKSVAEGGVK